MALLFEHDGIDGINGVCVYGTQQLELMLKVSKNHSLDGNRRRGNCSTTEEPSDEAQDEAADTAKMVATAAPDTASLEFDLKYRAVPAFI